MSSDNIEYRVEQLETKALDIGADVKQILTNHLPHIEKSFPEFEIKITTKLSEKIDKSTSKTMWAVGIGFTVMSILILVFKFVVV